MAAKWANYTQEGFRDLDGDDQAEIIALYRCSLMMEAVVANEQTKKARRAANRPKGKGHA